MRLHNTLTRQTQAFKPLHKDQVTLYTCGPTVYNYYQIGNLRNAVFNDTLRRALQESGYHVKHVMNITDVGHLVSDADEGEDKLEKGAKREGKSVWAVASHYTEAFKHDVAALNILPPNAYKSTHNDHYARATDFIPQQIELVQALLDKGFAYTTKQAIYFDVTKLSDYGKLTGQPLADKEAGARSDIHVDFQKRHPADFAVWFFATGRFQDHAMQWPTPWGSGFPGWHLECSAIIHATLGDPIDIHTGGVDHIGTHHPNEMAQTEAAFGHELARYWVHNEFILVDGQKMSKSKGNSYLLADVTKRGLHPLALRLLYLSAHYRTEMNFTWESLEAAQTSLLNLYAWADASLQRPAQMPAAWHEQLLEAVANDLGTPQALALINTWTAEYVPNQSDLARIDNLLGLKFAGRPDISEATKDLIQKREQARTDKDWLTSDEIRTKLAKEHLAIEDTPGGPRWRRTSL